MIARLTTERREQLANAAWGSVFLALTIALAIAVLWIAAAAIVGSVVMGQRIGAWV